jgi:hypothetical protein
MGGWDTTLTQDTVIHPATVMEALDLVQRFCYDFNSWLGQQNQVYITQPTGSSSHYLQDLAEDPDKIYGDIDLQMIAPALDGMTHYQFTSYWNRLSNQFINEQSPEYLLPAHCKPGHPIFKLGQHDHVQVDLMWHPPQLQTWGAARVTPERGMKGLLHGNMFSVLGELLDLSIQHAGVQYKTIDGQQVPFAKQKGTVLHTITADPNTFIYDIFCHYYQLITGKPGITAQLDALLHYNKGNGSDAKIIWLAKGIQGMAHSFELNSMYGKGILRSFTDADDFIQQFWIVYEGKAQGDVAAAKRDKAATLRAIERAAADRARILDGLDKVKLMFY